jgi:hypothetical protein
VAVDIEFTEDGQVLIRCVKGLLVFSREQLIDAIRKGEKYKRRNALEMRFAAQLNDAENHQAPPAITNSTSNDIVCGSEAETQAPPADRHASLAAVRRETFPNRKHVTPNAKEHIMAVFLTIELPASEIGETGYLRDIDYLQLPASHVKVVALEADGTWFGVREWSALEAPPPYQRARVQVSLEPGPTPLTAKNVVTLAKSAQAILDNFGTAGARR